METAEIGRTIRIRLHPAEVRFLIMVLKSSASILTAIMAPRRLDAGAIAPADQYRGHRQNRCVGRQNKAADYIGAHEPISRPVHPWWMKLTLAVFQGATFLLIDAASSPSWPPLQVSDNLGANPP